ncbi:hypothetical protein ACOSP7_014977 [Xanthoceras sorbifolium]
MQRESLEEGLVPASSASHELSEHIHQIDDDESSSAMPTDLIDDYSPSATPSLCSRSLIGLCSCFVFGCCILPLLVVGVILVIY